MKEIASIGSINMATIITKITHLSIRKTIFSGTGDRKPIILPCIMIDIQDSIEAKRSGNYESQNNHLIENAPYRDSNQT